MLISVIVCAHNPRIEVLKQTIEGIKKQTLNTDQWEFLLIDNASDIAIAQKLTPEISSGIRIIQERTLGLTPARLRGIREARGNLLVFVDDDNVLDPEYLKNALSICSEHPKIGAFGGNIKPIFEEAAPEWTQPYWYLLAVRDTREDHISMNHGDADAEPCGAGLCITKEIAEQYARYLADDPVRRALDRSGDSLASAGDMDLIFTAFDLNYGIGRFRSLTLDHLIPPNRLTEAYFLRIFEAMNYSGVILKKIRQISPNNSHTSIMGVLRSLKHFIFSNSLDRRMMLVERRGKKRALTDWANSSLS